MIDAIADAASGTSIGAQWRISGRIRYKLFALNYPGRVGVGFSRSIKHSVAIVQYRATDSMCHSVNRCSCLKCVYALHSEVESVDIICIRNSHNNYYIYKCVVESAEVIREGQRSENCLGLRRVWFLVHLCQFAAGISCIY